MFYSDLVDEMKARGASDQDVAVLNIHLMHDFPALAEAIWNQPMSTAQPDVDVPDELAASLLERLG